MLYVFVCFVVVVFNESESHSALILLEVLFKKGKYNWFCAVNFWANCKKHEGKKGFPCFVLMLQGRKSCGAWTLRGLTVLRQHSPMSIFLSILDGDTTKWPGLEMWATQDAQPDFVSVTVSLSCSFFKKRSWCSNHQWRALLEIIHPAACPRVDPWECSAHFPGSQHPQKHLSGSVLGYKVLYKDPIATLWTPGLGRQGQEAGSIWVIKQEYSEREREREREGGRCENILQSRRKSMGGVG